MTWTLIAVDLAFLACGLFGLGVLAWIAVAVLPPPIYGLVSLPPDWLATWGGNSIGAFLGWIAISKINQR